MKILYTYFKYFLALQLLLSSFFSFSQKDFQTKTLYEELEGYHQLIITTNLDSIISKKKYGDWQPAKVKIQGAGKRDIRLNIRVKARGKFRRMTCDFPPLKIDFNKKNLDSLGLNRHHDKFKIVTACYDNSNGEQHAMKEYWTYQMYEKVTEHSFKTHHLEIIYVDEKDSKKVIQGNGFIIEPANEMAHRIGGELVDSLGIQNHKISSTSYHNSILFYYMIGNTDWNLKMQKNLKLIRLKGDNSLTMVPYDFDMSMLVNPPYMVLYPDAKYKNYQNRYVKSYAKDKENLIQQIQRFSLLKTSSFQAYQSCDVLSKREKKKMDRFLKSFYKILEKENKMVKLFFR